MVNIWACSLYTDGRPDVSAPPVLHGVRTPVSSPHMPWRDAVQSRQVHSVPPSRYVTHAVPEQQAPQHSPLRRRTLSCKAITDHPDLCWICIHVHTCCFADRFLHQMHPSECRHLHTQAQSTCAGPNATSATRNNFSIWWQLAHRLCDLAAHQHPARCTSWCRQQAVHGAPTQPRSALAAQA